MNKEDSNIAAQIGEVWAESRVKAVGALEARKEFERLKQAAKDEGDYAILRLAEQPDYYATKKMN